MTRPLPPVIERTYDKEKLGYFGELGNGANACIRFLQSAVTKDELDNITLIENIPGSERWEVRDLFQRDVDIVRVEKSILPYLMDPGRVKFFNPLTLVLLPVSGGTVDSEVPYVAPVDFSSDGHNYTRYERQGLFSYEVHKQWPAFSKLLWNDAKVKLVAIDGQHRLSALKFWKLKKEPSDLDGWQIPVVILGVFRASNRESQKPASLLEIVRKTFVYINSKAETVNPARLILLNDEDVSSVCTQEFVQASHKNDCLDENKMEKSKLPLLFFDWRGQVKWRENADEPPDVSAPGSVLSLVEIRDWLKEYILGENFVGGDVLELEDLDPPLSESYRDTDVLTTDDAVKIRSQFLKVVYPGLSRFLEQFLPFRNYVQKVRNLEKAERNSTASGHAFSKLRFGNHPVLMGQMKEAVDAAYNKIIDQLRIFREDTFDQLVDREIGKRAVVFAFASLKKTRDEFAETTGSWEKHAEWFVPKVNAVYSDGWFKKYSELKADQVKFLTHICYDASGSIVNYKLLEVPKGLGLFLALLVSAKDLAKFTPEQQEDLWVAYGDPLDAILRKGFRREERARQKATFVGTPAQFSAAVNKDADAHVKSRLALIRKKLMNS